MEANFRRRSFRCGRVRSIRFAKCFENVQHIARGRESLSLLKNIDEDGAKAIQPSGISVREFERSRVKRFGPQTNLFKCRGGDRALRPKRPEEIGYLPSGLVPGGVNFLQSNGVRQQV